MQRRDLWEAQEAGGRGRVGAGRGDGPGGRGGARGTGPVGRGEGFASNRGSQLCASLTHLHQLERPLLFVPMQPVCGWL